MAGFRWLRPDLDHKRYGCPRGAAADRKGSSLDDVSAIAVSLADSTEPLRPDCLGMLARSHQQTDRLVPLQRLACRVLERSCDNAGLCPCAAIERRDDLSHRAVTGRPQ